jgi:hypothetical protein
VFFSVEFDGENVKIKANDREMPLKTSPAARLDFFDSFRSFFCGSFNKIRVDEKNLSVY